MNTEATGNNQQSGGHSEGQQQNISQTRPTGNSNPPAANRDDLNQQPETESDRAQREDRNTAARQGNSSI